MINARWRSRAGLAAFLGLLIAWGVASVMLRSDRKISTFRIEFGDAAFIVDRDWVMPSDRANNFDEYDVMVPFSLAGANLQSEMRSLDLEVRGAGRLPRQTLDINVRYRAGSRPGEQFSALREADGWVRLPDTNHDFRVATRDDSSPYTTPRVEAYEIKADTRFVIFCSVYYINHDRNNSWKSCGLKVPYYAQCASEKCTQMRVLLAPSQMTRWAEIAEEFRGVMRPFEVKQDLKYWQERERIHRPLALPEPAPSSNQLK